MTEEDDSNIEDAVYVVKTDWDESPSSDDDCDNQDITDKSVSKINRKKESREIDTLLESIQENRKYGQSSKKDALIAPIKIAEPSRTVPKSSIDRKPELKSKSDYILEDIPQQKAYEIRNDNFLRKSKQKTIESNSKKNARESGPDSYKVLNHIPNRN